MDTKKLGNKNGVKMVAHRGLSGIYTENTVKSFTVACERSYYGIECDVHLTSDGKYVIFHDDNTGRMCEEDVIIENTPIDKLRSLKFKDGVSQMPTLEEYLNIIAAYDKMGFVELKNPMLEKSIKEIIEICNRIYSLEKIVFISFIMENLITVRRLLPKQQIQFLTCDLYDGIADKLRENNFAVDIDYAALTEEKAGRLKKSGIRINCWTCDEQVTAERLIAWGVDFITTNILE